MGKYIGLDAYLTWWVFCLYCVKCHYFFTTFYIHVLALAWESWHHIRLVSSHIYDIAMSSVEFIHLEPFVYSSQIRLFSVIVYSLLTRTIITVSISMVMWSFCTWLIWVLRVSSSRVHVRPMDAMNRISHDVEARHTVMSLSILAAVTCIVSLLKYFIFACFLRLDARCG